MLVRGGIVVTADDAPAARDVPVAAGVIGAGTDGLPEAQRRVSAEGCLVLPGLVNGHDHLRSLLPFTRRSDTSAVPDLVAAAERAAVAATPADYRALTALAAARLVLTGVVAAIDHIYPVHQPGLFRAAVRAHAEIGLRAHMAYGLMTEGPAELVGPFDEQLARALWAADDVLPASRLFLAPVSLRQTSIEGYRATVAAADRSGLRLYTHVAESAEEVQRCQAEHGRRPIELLHELGFLRPGTVLVHCVHVNEREIELLAETGTVVAYCPSNHLKLAKGFAPVREMRAAGVRVCLGIDGMTDLFTEMRQAVYAQGSAAGRPGALSTQDALRMATTDGYAAIGEPGSGRLLPGDPADVVTVRTVDGMLAPLVDPVHALVHRGSGGTVRDVIVGGEQVVRDGRLVRGDLAALTEQAWRATRDIARRSGREVPTDWTWQNPEARPAPAATA
jgi:cytosine/adenosine deaminase-related metal-dependent hydrolase